MLKDKLFLAYMTTGHYICIVKRKIHKEDIIQSGYDLFYEKGYGVTGISEITERIGIPKGSFYNHFKSKEEFGVAVLDSYLNESETYLTEKLLNDERPALENLRKFYTDYIEMQENVLHCTKGCLMGNMTLELADVAESFQEKTGSGFTRLTSVFEACLDKAKDQGEINAETDTKKLARFIVSSWQGAGVRMKAEKTTAALKEFVEIIFNQLIN